MKAKIGAMVATVAAAVSAAGAAAWAKRRRNEGELDLEVPPAAGPATPEPGMTEAVPTPEAGAAAEPTPEAGADASTAGAEAPLDDLTVIKGLGAKSAERLAELGVTTLAQVAAWGDADIDRIAPQIKVGAERIRHEDWVGQAGAASKR